MWGFIYNFTEEMIKISLVRAIFILFVCLGLFQTCVYSVQRGGIQYTIPVEYSAIDENALNSEAESLFQRYLNSDNPQQQYILLEQMLSAYSILGNIKKDNPLYFTRLGIIFDKLGNDRYAKSNFFRSENIVDVNPYNSYAFGNFYFDRQEYLKALKLYKKAYNTGYSNHFYTLYQLGRIYEKLGDYSSAIKYYKEALQYKESEEIRLQIQTLNELLKVNSLYNRERGVKKK